LNMNGEMSWERIGETNLVPAGQEVQESFYLFSKMEDEVIQKQIDYLYQKTHKDMPEEAQVEVKENLISFDDFSKMEIKIGTILAAERVEGTDKLMKLSVDLGK
jgi:methionyl-tRNA synthetase